MLFNPAGRRSFFFLIAGFIGLFLLSVSAVDDTVNGYWGESNEELFWEELNECTTGVASGLATPDGRPLLWKNRDVGNSNQEFHYVDDGRIPFIAITYTNEDDEYYGGLNAVGFAVENSNSYNLPGGPGGNGWGWGDDDGEIQMLALATCRTVDDFEAILDSTNEDGRTLNCNYGAFDAFGGAAMFETAGYEHTRIDAQDYPEGFVVRSNYSMSGRGLDRRADYWGPNRHDRGYALWKWAAEHSELTVRYVYQQTIRNLGVKGMDDYHLPYDGYYEDYPYGCIPNGEAICRSTTRAIMVAQGVAENGNPDDAILWVTGGNQIGSIVTPLWVRAGSVPEEYDSPQGGRICDRARDISDWANVRGGFGRAVDTWRLTNPAGNGYWDWSFPQEDAMFRKVRMFLESDNFSYDRLEAFQNEIAQQVADSMEAWSPRSVPTEVSELVFHGRHIEILWERIPGGNLLAGGANPSGYAVYRSDRPFRRNNPGVRIAFVEDTRCVDENPPQSGAYYRIETVF